MITVPLRAAAATSMMTERVAVALLPQVSVADDSATTQPARHLFTARCYEYEAFALLVYVLAIR